MGSDDDHPRVALARDPGHGLGHGDLRVLRDHDRLGAEAERLEQAGGAPGRLLCAAVDLLLELERRADVDRRRRQAEPRRGKLDQLEREPRLDHDDHDGRAAGPGQQRNGLTQCVLGRAAAVVSDQDGAPAQAGGVGLFRECREFAHRHLR